MPTLLTMMLLHSALAAPVDDLAVAAQRGMPASVLQSLSEAVSDPLSHDDVVKLLRSGVPDRLIESVAPGHPTDAERAAAAAAGPLAFTPYQPPSAVTEYKGLTERAWVSLAGVEVVVRTRDAVVTGVLTDVHTPTAFDPSDTVTLTVDGDPIVINLIQVVSVRRVDGARVAVVTSGDLREQEVEDALRGDSPMSRTERAERSRRTGSAMVGGGAALLGLGLLSLVATQAELSTARSASDIGEITDHANAAITWSTIGYGSLSAGAPLLVGGVLVISIGGADR